VVKWCNKKYTGTSIPYTNSNGILPIDCFFMILTAHKAHLILLS
jgi:hypothetical protein